MGNGQMFLLGLCALLVGCQSVSKKEDQQNVTVAPGTSMSLAKTGLSEKDVVDAYAYILGRYLVIRQERKEITENNLGYNNLKYNRIGQISGANPNLDIVFAEAWLAVDEDSCQVLTVPPIKNRYHTVQVMDEWANTITNINDRTYPESPDGKFAFCLKNAGPTPDNAYRIDLPSKKAKLVVRIGRKGNDGDAAKLQKLFKISRNKNTDIDLVQKVPNFANRDPIRVEAFEYPMVESVLASAPDSLQIAKDMQRKVRVVAGYVAISDENKTQIDNLINDKGLPQLKRVISKFGEQTGGWNSTVKYTNGFGEDYWLRTAANFDGIWGNVAREVVSYVTSKDADDAVLNGSSTYLLYFSKNALPRNQVDGLWSLTLLNAPEFKVINSANRLTYGRDGSLTLAVGARPKGNLPISNWLPGTEGKEFSLNMRMYAPRESVLSGHWTVPPVIKVQGFDLPKSAQSEPVRVGDAGK